MRPSVAEKLEERETIVNGLDVEQLEDTIYAVKHDPSLGEFHFRVSNRWLNGARNRVAVKDFYGTKQTIKREHGFSMDVDEPPVLLGNDEAANPAEYLLAALSGCMTTSLACQAAAEGIKIDSIESSYDGKMDLQGFLGLNPNVRPGFQEILVRFRVKSDASEDQIAELIDRSPIADTVRNPVKVRVIVEKV